MRLARFIFISLIIIFFPVFSYAEGYLKIHFIGLEGAEAILLECGQEYALIDTGSEQASGKLINYLQQKRVSKIKYIILTHHHEDHASGVFEILNKFEVGQVFDNGMRLHKNVSLERRYVEVVRSKKNFHILEAGDRIRLGGEAYLDVFWPVNKDEYSDNDTSLVMKLTYHGFSCLFTGDLNNKGEKRLLILKPDLKANILKVGHHGYKDATSEEFLTAVSPEAGIVNVASWWPFDLVAEALVKSKIKIYRTDKDGNIVVIVKPDGQYAIETSRNNP